MSSRNVSIKLNGEIVYFESVQTVSLHETGSEAIVDYIEVTDTTAEDADVSRGKHYYDRRGTFSTGTNDGGGGGEIVPNGWPVIATHEATMTSALAGINIGRLYKWNPDVITDSAFVVGEIYQVYDDEEEEY